jgi:hypothetical protein
VTTDNALIISAQTVLERWDSPSWDWDKNGSTAEIMGGLRRAAAAEASFCAAKWVDANPADAAAVVEEMYNRAMRELLG